MIVKKEQKQFTPVEISEYTQKIHQEHEWDKVSMQNKLLSITSNICRAYDGVGYKDRMRRNRSLTEMRMTDAFIRILDIGGTENLVYKPEKIKLLRFKKDDTFADKSFILVNLTTIMGGFIIRKRDYNQISHSYSSLVVHLLEVASQEEIDLKDVIEERFKFRKRCNNSKLA